MVENAFFCQKETEAAVVSDAPALNICNAAKLKKNEHANFDRTSFNLCTIICYTTIYYGECLMLVTLDLSNTSKYEILPYRRHTKVVEEQKKPQ